MREIGSIYVGDGPKLMGAGYRGHDLRGTGHIQGGRMVADGKRREAAAKEV